MSEPDKPRPKRDMDDRVSIPLDPEEALRGLLAADPDEDDEDDDQESEAD